MIARIICALTNHRYVVEKRWSQQSLRIGCTRCGRRWMMNTDAQAFIPWSASFEQEMDDIKHMLEKIK